MSERKFPFPAQSCANCRELHRLPWPKREIAKCCSSRAASIRPPPRHPHNRRPLEAAACKLPQIFKHPPR